MQVEIARRSNRERSEATRADLIAAARRLFVANGYAETATPDIVAAAGVTRGALYHHFEDKRALFGAVAEAEAEAVAAEIELAAPGDLPAREALVRGGETYLLAMAEPGRTRLLLLDGPAVLGRGGMDAIDARHAARSLREGVVHAVETGVFPPGLSVDAITQLLAASFDRAALAIEAGNDPEDYKKALAAIIDGLAARGGR